MKRCCKCKIEKPTANFGRLSSAPDGLRYNCKDCRHEYVVKNRDSIQKANQDYYKANKNALLSKNKEYRITNSEAINKQRKQYREQEHVKIHIKEMSKAYLPIRKQKIKELRITDISFRISESLRSKFHKYLKNQKTSLMNYLGCDLDFFREWLTFRFNDKMNWDNYGTVWHIDHVLPINQFNLQNTSDIQICYHWTNMQPLIKFDNQSKSDKILLYQYFNNLVNVFRFKKLNAKYIGYQAVNESLQWLRIQLKYGNNSTYEVSPDTEIGNPQPRL